MKPILKSLLTSTGTIVLSLSAISCRDLGVDGGKSLLTCAASSVSYTQGAEIGLLDPSVGGNELAQSFKPQSTVKNVKSVALGLQLVSTVSAGLSGNLYASIVADKSGMPDLFSPVGVAASLPVSKVTTTAQAVTFTFGNPISQLTAGTTYWIVLNANFQWNSSAHVAWLGTDSNTYSDGQALTYNGLNWLNPDAGKTDPTNRRDLSFQIGCL